MVICLERGADLHMAQLMPLPLTVSCFSIIQIGFTFPVPAHPGSPGQRAVKRVCVCVYIKPSCLRVTDRRRRCRLSQSRRRLPSVCRAEATGPSTHCVWNMSPQTHWHHPPKQLITTQTWYTDRIYIDVINVCNVYQKFITNAFVIISSFTILIYVTWNVEKAELN